MSPDQFLARMKKGIFAPAYLFLGPEAYDRRRCRQALLDVTLAPEEREEGLTHYDLRENSLADAIDDARSLSLFAAKRVIVIANAELGLPRQRANEEDDAEAPSSTGAASLDAYMKDPTPGVVLVLEAVQFDFQGEEKKRLDRIAKFYSSVTDTVELRRYPADEARGEAQILAKQAGISIDPEALSFLVEALGADVARIAVEIEKLRLYAGSGRTITRMHATSYDAATISPAWVSSLMCAMIPASRIQSRYFSAPVRPRASDSHSATATVVSALACMSR